jgi:ferredoxin
MTYVVTEQCIKCKYTDCVEVCPVDCFREGDEMLVIDPDICIDCAVCEPACPVDAIKPDTHPDGIKWKELNARLSQVWQAVSVKPEPLPDADGFAGVPGKFDLYLKRSLEP